MLRQQHHGNHTGTLSLSSIKRQHMSKTLVLQWACRVKFSPNQLRGDLALAGDSLTPQHDLFAFPVWPLANPNAGLLPDVLLAGELYF